MPNINIRSIDPVNRVEDYVPNLPEQGFQRQLQNISDIDAEIDRLSEELFKRQCELRRAREQLYKDVEKNYSEAEINRARRELVAAING